MKIWLKLLIGSGLGIALGFLLPYENLGGAAILPFVENLAIHLGRYTLAPLLFFSLAVAVFELRQERSMWPTVAKSVAVLVIAAVTLVFIGLAVVTLFPPARIPILIEGQKESVALDIPTSILELFPTNAFAALMGPDGFILPLCVLAFFLGAGLSYDKSYTKGVASLLDSLSRMAYYVASFFTEILGAIMIVLGAFWAVRYRAAISAEVFRDLLALIGVLVVVVGFGVLPLFLYLFGPKTNPWKQLYGTIGPALAAYFSGDYQFALPVLIRHAKESHGVRRRTNIFALTIFSAFGRAGSASIAALSLIVIIKSYSSLGVTLADMAFIAGSALLVSLLLSRHPGDGTYAALAVLCGMYGHGFEAGYLILKPVAFYLVAAGTFLDVMVAALGTYAVARWTGTQEEKELRHFV